MIIQNFDFKFKKFLIILDRDDTLIKDMKHSTNIDKLIIFPEALKTLKEIQSKFEVSIVIATNQAGISRKIFSEKSLIDFHNKLFELLANEKVYINGIFVCPHDELDKCGCRKPKAGLFEQILFSSETTPSNTISVGNSMNDKIASEKVSIDFLFVKSSQNNDFYSDTGWNAIYSAMNQKVRS